MHSEGSVAMPDELDEDIAERDRMREPHLNARGPSAVRCGECGRPIWLVPSWDAGRERFCTPDTCRVWLDDPDGEQLVRDLGRS